MNARAVSLGLAIIANGLAAADERAELDQMARLGPDSAHGYLYGNADDGHPFATGHRVPEGNHRVVIELAPSDDPQPITIKSESRRLMVERFTASPGRAATLEFLVNVRTPQLANGGTVRLKTPEANVWHWDDLLQLEFHAEAGAIRAIRVSPAPAAMTVFLVGDSTVTDQPAEPWAGWGQMLPRFFGPDVAVANHAESGMALRSFREDGRLRKVLEQIKPGDYLFIQFGHNDQKERGAGIGPWRSYSDDLRNYVRDARDHGAHPVLITSVKRRRFDHEGRQVASLDDYPLAVRRVAAEMGVPLIDLNLMSGVLYGALGPEGSKWAFVHYPAGTFAGQSEDLRDDSHFSAYGGYQLARCVVEGIRLALPQLAKHLAREIGNYDPARPDPFASVDLPASPSDSARLGQGHVPDTGEP